MFCPHGASSPLPGAHSTACPTHGRSPRQRSCCSWRGALAIARFSLTSDVQLTRPVSPARPRRRSCRKPEGVFSAENKQGRALVWTTAGRFEGVVGSSLHQAPLTSPTGAPEPSCAWGPCLPWCPSLGGSAWRASAVVDGDSYPLTAQRLALA